MQNINQEIKEAYSNTFLAIYESNKSYENLNVREVDGSMQL